MPKLDGKAALVTGGTGGIGLAAAPALAKQGAYVYIPVVAKGNPDLGENVKGLSENAN